MSLNTSFQNILEKLRSRIQIIGLILLAGALTWFVVVPLVMVIWGAFRNVPPGVAGSFTLNNFIKAYQSERLLNAIKNSVVFGLGASSISFAGGTFLAWVTERTDAPFRKVIYSLVLLPIIVPSILFATSWLFLLNPKIGILNKLAMQWFGFSEPIFNGYGMWGMIWAQGVDHYGLPFLLMAAAFRSMDPSLEEAAEASGAGLLMILRTVTLPLLLPAVLATLLICFIRCIETFEVAAVLGIPAGISVFATEVWLAIARTRPPDFNLSATFAMGFMLVTVVGIYLYHRATRMSEKYVTVTGKGYRPTRIKLGVWRIPIGLFCLLLLSVCIVLPVFVFVWTSLMPFYAVPSWKAFSRITLDNYRYVLTLSTTLEVFFNNIVVGFAAASAGVIFAAIISWTVVRTRIPGRKFLDVIAFAPIAVPGTVMGIALLWLYLTVPIPIYGTLWILIVGFMSKYMTYAVRATHAALTQIHPELEEASKACGASWFRTFTRVTLPLMTPGLLIGFLFILSLSFRVLGLPIMISHVSTRMFPSFIYDLYADGGYEALSALGVLIMLFLLIIAGISKFISNRFGVQEAE